MAPARMPTSTGAMACPLIFTLMSTMAMMRGTRETMGLGSFSLGSSAKTSPSLATKCSPLALARWSHIRRRIMPRTSMTPQEMKPLTAPAM